ncbi:MAG: hypothetical protein NC254_14575, partial [bacterium]|nr:hypothetical protein [bacterium]
LLLYSRRHLEALIKSVFPLVYCKEPKSKKEIMAFAGLLFSSVSLIIQAGRREVRAGARISKKKKEDVCMSKTIAGDGGGYSNIR